MNDHSIVDPFVVSQQKVSQWVLCTLCGGTGWIESSMSEHIGYGYPCRCDKGFVEMLNKPRSES